MEAPIAPKPQKQTAKKPIVTFKGQQKYSTFKTIITLAATAIVVIHLTICLILMLDPTAKIFNNQSFTKTFQIYALPGPYFRDENIISSPSFYIAGKKDGIWEKWRNPELDNFNTFHQSYWHYDKLKQSDLERNLVRKFSRRFKNNDKEDFIKFREFKDLHRYFEGEYFKERPDSIRMLYTLSTYKPRERKTKIDTLFLLKYKPW